ncbi:ASST-domain-containing protein [Xylariomycetidae sp. FL0641]|nr:ASST-domain-containing protein [Xylariomycetidae sp. FL0641]
MRFTTSGAATVALLASQAAAAEQPVHIVDDFTAYQNGAYGENPNVTFKSVDITAPLFQVSKWDKEASGLGGGYILMSTDVGDERYGAMFFSGDDLSLVWALPRPDGGADANVQTLDGENVLTVFAQFIPSHSENYDLIYGQDLQLKYNFTTIRAAALADAHEFFLTDEGTAVVTEYPTRSPWDMTSVGGGKNGTLLDSCFQDINFQDNRLVFKWCASDHFPVSRSLSTYNASEEFDAYHINAVSKGPDGNYLVSLRHLANAFNVNATDGSIIWQVGGATSDFAYVNSTIPTVDEEGFVFQFQHEVRYVDDSMKQISLFDNHQSDNVVASAGACRTVNGCSRGLVLDVDYEAMTYTVSAVLNHPRDLIARAMGSNVLLPNGNRLVQWGIQPSITEHDQQGDVVLEAEYGLWLGAAHSYRTFWIPEADWVTSPTTKPDVAVEDNTVYVSWNGATKVKQWAIVACGTDTPKKTVTRDGFETAIDVSDLGLDKFAVAALDKNGETLATSKFVTV